MKWDDDANWDLIPEHCRDGLRAHIEKGRKTGSFLAAVLSNDLMEAATRADRENLAALNGYAIFLLNYCPRDSHGSREKMEDWRKSGGLEGIQKRADADYQASKEGGAG